MAELTREEAAKQIAELAPVLLARRRAKTSFLEWCKFVLAESGLEPARHHLKIIELLQQVNDGQIKKLLIMAPPGSAKSTFVSQLFPPYWMLTHPGSKIIGASNTEDLSTDFSRTVRNHVMEQTNVLGFGLDPTQTNVQKWATDRENRCTYVAVGAGGTIVGRRGSLLLLDDPYRSLDDAQTQTVRDKIWRWYANDLKSRMTPGAPIVVIMTRFHCDDLVGRLLEIEPNEWTVASFPAICETTDPSEDILGRSYGELLWPEYHTAEFLEGNRRVAGERNWVANYQQRPTLEAGSLFDADTLNNSIIHEIPRDIVDTVRAWDLAGTFKKAGDWAVGLKLGRRSDGRFVVLDVQRFRADPSRVEDTMLMIANQDGIGCKIALSQDPGQAGASQIMHLTRKLAGFRVLSERETGDKEIRASPAASIVNSANMQIVAAHWNREFIAELSAFPTSRHDDQVDALSRAFGVIAKAKAAAKAFRLNYMAR